jgi:hypothetical protein
LRLRRIRQAESERIPVPDPEMLVDEVEDGDARSRQVCLVADVGLENLDGVDESVRLAVCGALFVRWAHSKSRDSDLVETARHLHGRLISCQEQAGEPHQVFAKGDWHVGP